MTVVAGSQFGFPSALRTRGIRLLGRRRVRKRCKWPSRDRGNKCPKGRTSYLSVRADRRVSGPAGRGGQVGPAGRRRPGRGHRPRHLRRRQLHLSRRRPPRAHRHQPGRAGGQHAGPMHLVGRSSARKSSRRLLFGVSDSVRALHLDSPVHRLLWSGCCSRAISSKAARLRPTWHYPAARMSMAAWSGAGSSRCSPAHFWRPGRSHAR